MVRGPKHPRLGSLVPTLVSTVLLTLAPAAAQDFPAFETAGHFGGFVNTAAVRGDFAFVGRADVLSVLDATSPELRQVAFLEFPDEPTAIALDGDFAYLSYRNTLEVVDIADPARPRAVSTSQPVADGTFISSLATVGSSLYAALDGAGLTLVDVSDPAAPSPAGSLALSARTVFADGTLVAAVTADGRLVLLDAAGPALPVERGSLVLGADSRALFVAGRHAYVGGGQGQGLAIVDVSDPDLPALAGSFGQGTATFDRIFVDGDVAFLAERDGTLHTVDMSRPDGPVPLGTLPVPGFGGPASLHVAAGSAYFTVSGRFHAADVSDPARPVLDRASRAPEELSDLRFAGDRLYVASPDDLWCYDATDPAAPALLGTAPKPGDDRLFRLFPAGDRLYAVDLGRQVHVLDFADPARPSLLGSYQAPDLIHELHAEGDTLFLLTLGGLLEVVDGSDPANPVKVGELRLPGAGRDLFVDASRGRLYAAFAQNPAAGGLLIADLADPTTPLVQGTHGLAGEPIAVWARDDLAVVAGNRNGSRWLLDAVDVADPASPRAAARPPAPARSGTSRSSPPAPSSPASPAAASTPSVTIRPRAVSSPVRSTSYPRPGASPPSSAARTPSWPRSAVSPSPPSRRSSAPRGGMSARSRRGAAARTSSSPCRSNPPKPWRRAPSRCRPWAPTNSRREPKSA